MLRFGPRNWLPFLVISWGVFATAMALISDATSFNILRFLLGALAGCYNIWMTVRTAPRQEQADVADLPEKTLAAAE